MAIVINGSGEISGIAVGGLPDGIVDAGTLATNSVDSAELIDGAVDNSHLADDAVDSDEIAAGAIDAAHLASGVGGKLLQVVSTNNTSEFSTTSTTMADVYSLAITPSSTSSKILVLTTNHIYNTQQDSNSWRGCLINIVRGSTVISSDSGKYGTSAFIETNAERYMTYSSRQVLDSPNTDSAVTYKIMGASSNGTQMIINNGGSYGSGGHLTLMEIAG